MGQVRKRIVYFIRCLDTSDLFQNCQQVAEYLGISRETVRKKLLLEDGLIQGMRFRYETLGFELPMGDKQKAG